MSQDEYRGSDHGSSAIQAKFKDLPSDQIAAIQAEMRFGKTAGYAIKRVIVLVAFNTQPPNRMIWLYKEYKVRRYLPFD